MAGPLILVVDDEVEIRDLLETRLTGAGCRVVTAGDSYGAIAKFREAKPQLLLLDFQMPAGTGADFLRTIRHLDIGAGIPAIFLSAVPVYQIQMAAAPDDKTRFLEKPLDFDRLLATIEELLGPWKEPPKPAAPTPPSDPDDHDPDNPRPSGTVLDLDAEP